MTTDSQDPTRQERLKAPVGRDVMGVALADARTAILIAAILFGGLWLAGTLSFVLAIVGFAAISASAMGQAYLTETRQRRALVRIRARRGEAESRAVVGSVVLEQLPDAVALLDGKGRIVFHNRSAEKFLGKTATGKLIPSTLREPALLDAIDRVRKGAPAETIEVLRPGPVEQVYQALITPADAAGSATPSPDGTPTLLVLHDTTNAKRVEQMRVDFIANASHELKTPLASVSGFIETLQGPAKDDEEARERFLAIMGEQTARMQRLIEDLLSLSRIELREHQPPTGRVNMKALVRDVVEAVTPIAERDEVTIDVSLPEDLPEVKGDWDELHQVVQNLVDNAIKYGRSGGRVEISGAELPGEDPQVELKVRDFGPGIAPQHIPRLTERFYRSDIASSREKGGTGLGLAIVKHILVRHGGELSIDSVVGEGATFSVRLPARDRKN
ncbi:MAG: ATP-binding protein [Parvibaculaceae bacterium]